MPFWIQSAFASNRLDANYSIRLTLIRGTGVFRVKTSESALSLGIVFRDPAFNLGKDFLGSTLTKDE